MAEAILFAAEHPRRDIIVVGGTGKMLEVMERISPSLVDRLMLAGGAMFELQRSDRPDDGQDSLFEPLDETGSTTGDFGRLSSSTSLYTRHLEQHPNRKRALLALAAAGAVALVRRAGR